MKQVMVMGGTHGNEWGGIQLVKNWRAQTPAEWQDYPFEVILRLANPDAVRHNRRYLDQDLNRSFRATDLSDPSQQNREMQRARSLQPDLQQVDFLLDLHNTTANMGCTIILSDPAVKQDPLILQLCAHLCQIDPRVMLYYMPFNEDDSPYLPSQAKRDLTIEVGPMAHGTLKADLYQLTQSVTAAALEFLAAWEQDKAPFYTKPLIVYEQIQNLDYPRTPACELAALVHPDVQDHDFEPVQPGEPLFMDFAGNTIVWSGHETVWPTFVNEQAYYEKGLAMSLTRKCKWQISEDLSLAKSA